MRLTIITSLITISLLSGTSVPVTPDSQKYTRVGVMDGMASVGHRDGCPAERAAWDCTPAGTNRHTVYTDSALSACKHECQKQNFGDTGKVVINRFIKRNIR